MSRKTEVALRDRGAVSGLLTGLSFVAGVGGGSTLADSPYPRPGSEPAEVRRYFTENVRSARLSATGQLVSSASLARFTASVARLAGRSGKGSEGLRKAALAGGALAATSLATSGLHTLALGGLGASLAAVLPRRAGGRIDTGGAVLGAGGMRDRRGAAWPPLAPGDALPRRRRTRPGEIRGPSARIIEGNSIERRRYVAGGFLTQ